MPNTIDTILIDAVNALQTLNASIAGVTFAPQLSAYPTQLNTMQLPALLTWPSDGQLYVKGGAARASVRTFVVLGFVQPLTQNDIPTNAAAALLLLQRCINAYTNVSNIPLANPSPTVPYQLTIESGPDMQHSDGGLVPDLSFGGAAFHGFRLRINVRALW